MSDTQDEKVENAFSNALGNAYTNAYTIGYDIGYDHGVAGVLLVIRLNLGRGLSISEIIDGMGALNVRDEVSALAKGAK